jgi:hypothetical protein
LSIVLLINFLQDVISTQVNFIQFWFKFTH